MSQVGFEEVASRAIKISELIEEIIRLDDLLALHAKHDARQHEIQQYIDRRLAFVEELNGLLNPHHLKLIVEEQAA
ncbi:MAG: hypothetical protein DA408_11665 [Bacteroidetes bacterium]|nr:MAG: hypothetical protein C7N36_12710 [Bacteroidota bacterium]PTM12172.1 MAG: hypothetical protein DA408_11665 [Bacteroidota bacterium]